MKNSLKDMFYANLKTKLGALMVKKQLGTISKHLDYKTIGGSPLLGTAKPVFKAHGSSDAKAVKNAVRQARDYVSKGVSAIIDERITSGLAPAAEASEDKKEN